MKKAQRDALLKTLRTRFEENMQRHPGIAWSAVEARLIDSPAALASLHAMEESGGEPDVIGEDGETGRFTLCDCSAESPAGRRSVCYDREAREARKKHAPETSAVELADRMGADLLHEEEYRRLQAVGPFDTKTSSWLRTPAEIRQRGGAVFGDHRFGTVWVYHNGADSYYAARGFRCAVRI
jgi:hypothetical protein